MNIRNQGISNYKFLFTLVGIVAIIIIFNPLSESEPVKINETNATKIAYIEIWGNYTNTEKLFEEIIEPEINQYAEEHNYNTTFDFIVVKADDGGRATSDTVVELQSVGIRYVIGSNCVACVSYSFIREHDMILISPFSQQNLFHIKDEHMFRVCPADIHNARPIQRLTESLGVTKAVMLLWDGNIGSDLYEGFNSSWVNETILREIRYDGATTDFRSQISILNQTIYDALEDGVPQDELGVIALSLGEIVRIYNQTEDYPLLRELTWIGYEGTSMLDKSKYIDSVEGLDQLGLYSPVYSVQDNEKWRKLQSRYFELTGEMPSTDIGYDYDAAWVFALTLMEAGTSDRASFADKIYGVASSFEGATGFVYLDDFGDRMNASYDIWVYVNQNGETISKIIGFYDGESDKITWN